MKADAAWRRKLRLGEAQNWRCALCGARMEWDGPRGRRPTIDHVVPKSWGGSSDDDNLVVACRDCNERRGHRVPDELYDLLVELNPGLAGDVRVQKRRRRQRNRERAKLAGCWVRT